MNLSIKYSDKVGAASNILCMLHCFATPFIFLSQTQTAHIGHDVPFAWQIINYFFITMSGIAVYYSAKNTTNNFVKVARIKLLINNLLDRKYESFGGHYFYNIDNKTYSGAYYYPMAGINFLAGIDLIF